MTSKKAAIVRSHMSGGTSPSRGFSKKSNSKNPTNSLQTAPSKGFERLSLIAMFIGCILLLYLTELLISSNTKLGEQFSRAPFRTKQLPNVISSIASSLKKESKPKDAPLILNVNQKKGKSKLSHNQAGDDAQVAVKPTLSPAEEYYLATNTYPDEKYIALIPGKKTGVRQDRRVVLEKDFIFEPYTRPPGSPSGIVGRPRALVEAENVLKKHPLHDLNQIKRLSLEDTIQYIYESDRCGIQNKPIFLTMATVGDDLYWQLIENFVYTMVKYSVSDCSLVICVSDTRCMDMCAASYFPCYEYRSEVVEAALAAGKSGGDIVVPSVMEQIGEVKLLHIPKALSANVSVFMLDLDVGFLADPMIMVKAFTETPRVDIFVQEDMIFVMNRSRAAWKTWSVEPLPNIGLFLVRGNSKTKRVFDIAWDRYNKMTDADSKKEPGKDQNHVLEGMRNSRVKIGLRYAYFDNYTAILLDKYMRLTDPLAELGGEASALPMIARKSIAVHTTCYEKSTKVMGLKATNAFWNPKYYDPLRRTITKPLLHISDAQLLDEVRSLIWLGLRTNRAVIVPNILGPSTMTVAPYYHPNQKSNSEGMKLWPGFRVVKFKRVDGKNVLKVDVLEPGFYWRVNRDYDEPPAPKVLVFNSEKQSIEDIRKTLDEDEYDKEPRIVLASSSARSDVHSESSISLIQRIVQWAEDSVGWFEEGYSNELKRYGLLPSVKKIRNNHESVDSTLQGMRTCNKIFIPMKGNRSCFEICD